MNPNQVLADVTQGGLSPQEIKDCKACHTRGYILGVGDILADIEGLRVMLAETGRLPDAKTVLDDLEKDIQESLFLATGILARLLGQEDE